MYYSRDRLHFYSPSKTVGEWKWYIHNLLWFALKHVFTHQMFQFSSVQFSRSVVSDSLRPHESQHARPPCPSPSPRAHSESRPSSPCCHPAIWSCIVPFSPCRQSLPASESFPMSQLFAYGGQRVDLLQNGLVGSPCSPRDSQESSPTPQFKCINSSALSLLHSPTLTSVHDHRKNHGLD